MLAIRHVFSNLSRVLSIFLGGLALVLALSVILTARPASEIATWATDVLGLSFLTLLIVLIVTCLYCWVRLLGQQKSSNVLWVEIGVQAANGVTTLALTFTLLGISLGIGSLANQDLTPTSIHGVISEMTANFSLAFMTTVIGLPISALLRSLIVITDQYKSCNQPRREEGVTS